MRIANLNTDVTIVGAGPAGASLSIRLAKAGFDVALIEKDKFPRHKLCGEFISPECLEQFRQIGVESSLLTAGGDRISGTHFYSTNGKSVSIDSDWFDHKAGGALGLSRAEMDDQLLNTAEAAGVRILKETTVNDTETKDGRIESLNVRSKEGVETDLRSDIYVDATGRSRVLSNLVTGKRKKKSNWIAFKAHFRDVEMDSGRCEIYFFEGGYGGLSYVENQDANHCFLIRTDVAMRNGGKAEDVFRNVVLKNSRAKEVFSGSTRNFDWLAVAIDRFGMGEIAPAPNLFAVGDSAAFIDPFTGSGMLLALQSADLLSRITVQTNLNTEQILKNYPIEYHKMVKRRLRVCGVMRRLSFSPGFANIAIQGLRFAPSLRQVIAKATRESVRT